MNTSELVARQAELDTRLKDQDFIKSIPMEQANLLRREKETLDAFLSTENQVQAANIPDTPQQANQGIAVAPVVDAANPQPNAAPAPSTAQQQPSQPKAPVKKAVQNKAPAPKAQTKVVSKKKK